jgi:protein gp37
MTTLSHIEWTEVTWNPVTGCDKISAGCKNCYAERMAKRLKAMGSARYENGFALTLHDDLIDLPRKWKKSRIVFVNSMSDLFHPDIPLQFIKRVFKTMNETPQHTYQILTKRSDRLLKLSKHLKWSKNIWMGVSVEDDRVIGRIKDLQKVPAVTRFLSLEPLIGPLEKLPLKDIHWVIVGGESGPKSRYMNPDWVDSIRRQCQKAEVAFFFKQWGGVQKHRYGRELDGQVFNEMPGHYAESKDYYPLQVAN